MNIVEVAVETVGKETADTNQLCGLRVETSACINMSGGEVSECEFILSTIVRDGEERKKEAFDIQSHTNNKAKQHNTPNVQPHIYSPLAKVGTSSTVCSPSHPPSIPNPTPPPPCTLTGRVARLERGCPVNRYAAAAPTTLAENLR